MKASLIWSRVLLLAGLGGMLIGIIDPLEGSVATLAGIGVAAVGSHLSKCRFRLFLDGSFVSVAIGVVVMIALSVIGGIGGDTGRSLWWALLILPYPVGWLVGVVAGILDVVASFRSSGAPSSDSAAQSKTALTQ